MSDDANISADLENTLRGYRHGGDDTAGALAVSDDEGYVGDAITFRGRNLPATEQFTVQWQTVDGNWGVLEANEVVGPQYQPRTETVTTVTTDDDGRFDHRWEVPEDYGGSHAIELLDDDGGVVDRTEFDIQPWFEVDRTEAPLGETFTITGYGIGPSMLTNNYQIAWDNGIVGFVTGVKNRGTATAQVRAVGPPGEHVLQVWRNHRGVPFLQNNTQSPFGPVAGGRQSTWTVAVTEPDGEPRRCWIDQQLHEEPIPTHYPELDEDTAAELAVTPTCGQAGTTVRLSGLDFPPETTVELVWHRHQGHRVKGIPITPEPKPDVLPTVTTDEDGEFSEEITIPPDVGSTRPITAVVDGHSVAVTGFMMQPSISSFTPKEGPVGTDIEIELSGVGWPVYENAPYFVYDNKLLGYVCGVDDDDESGITRARFRASGEPGYHFIDVYPSIFQMQDDEPDFEIMPHLSYIDNHPVRPLPAWHFCFEITE